MSLLAHTIIVLVLFGTVWVIGLSAVLYATIDYRTKSVKTDFKYDDNVVLSAPSALQESMSRRRQELMDLRAYVMHLMPAAYSPTMSLMEQMKVEIVRHHRYFSYFSSTLSNESRKSRIITGLSILTAANCFFFAIALFYDLDVSSGRSRSVK